MPWASRQSCPAIKLLEIVVIFFLCCGSLLAQAGPLSTAQPIPKGQWMFIRTKPDLAGESKLEAFIRGDADSTGGHGDFELTVECDAVTKELSFRILYSSTWDNSVGIRHKRSGGLLPGYQVRFKLDDGPITNWMDSGEHSNEALLKFYGKTDIDLTDAKLMKVELPLTDDDTTILKIPVGEPAFKSWLSTCH